MRRDFLLAVVPDADLDEPRDAPDEKGVVHDRRVGMNEALVGVAQVAMGVDMEDAVRAAIAEGLHESERDAVISP